VARAAAEGWGVLQAPELEGQQLRLLLMVVQRPAVQAAPVHPAGRNGNARTSHKHANQPAAELLLDQEAW
jgi:hypothetical protein